jgi:hypothetical protein
MSVFGNYASAEVVEAAEKFISKMDERDLAAAIEQSERTMSADGRARLVEAIFDAFRHRGESSEDVAEAAGTPLEAMTRGDDPAVRSLLSYARTNPGLLKDAATALIERSPAILEELPPQISDGIARRLEAK